MVSAELKFGCVTSATFIMHLQRHFQMSNDNCPSGICERMALILFFKLLVALLENQFPAAMLTWKFLQNSVGRTERVGLVSRSVCIWEQASCAFGKKTGSRATLSLKYLVFPETPVFC